MDNEAQVTNSAPETTTSTPEAAKPEKKIRKPAVKKTKKPVAKKKAVKKVAKKKASKPKAAKKKKGSPAKREAYVNPGKMLNMHARILKVLDNSKSSLTVEVCAAKGGLTPGITAQYLGQLDPKARKRFEQLYLHYPTLLTMGYVRNVAGKPRRGKDGEFTEALGPAEFEITAAGRKAIRGAEGQEVLKKLREKDKESGRAPIKLGAKNKTA